MTSKDDKRAALVTEAREAAGLGDREAVARLNAEIAALDKPERAVAPKKRTETRKAGA